MNLLRALATVSSLTLVSRILGYLRDFIIARAFGASLATDAFFVAFRIPNLLRRLFAEGAFSQAFVPVLAEHKNKGSPEEVRSLIDGVATLLLVALVVVAALGMAAAPIIVYLSAPGFAADQGKFGLTVTMLRITFPYIAFISLVAFAAGILNTWNRFSVPAITPALLNLCFKDWNTGVGGHDARVAAKHCPANFAGNHEPTFEGWLKLLSFPQLSHCQVRRPSGRAARLYWHDNQVRCHDAGA